MVIVNYWAVLVGAVITMVIGFLWYGPLFGKMWQKMMGFTPEQMEAGKAKGMTQSMILMFLASLVTSYVLWNFIAFAGGFLQVGGWMVGCKTAFFAWLGFVLPVTLSTVLWEGRSWSLWCFNSAYYLVNLAIVGSVLAAWM